MTHTTPVRTRPLLLALAVCAASTTQAAKLEEVIVTAEKRATSVQDTSIAVTALTGDELDRGLINKPLDLQFNVPNMLMSKGNFTTAQISIRGIGNLAVGSASDSGAGSHFNGVYLNNGRIFEIEFYDAERVEVLRGPQGTLYGRNTTAGVLNFITNKPNEEFGGDATLELGNYEHQKFKGAINIPITENISQRFAGFYLQRDGFVDNEFTGNDIDDRDMYSIRSATRWQSERVDATFTINYFEEDSSRMRGSNQQCKRDPEGILGCLPTSLANENSHAAATATAFLINTFVEPVVGQAFPVDDFINSPKSDNPREQFLDFEPRYQVEDTMASLEINWDIDNMTLTSLTGYHDSRLNARNDYDFTVASEPWPIDVTLDLGPDGSITTNRLYNTDQSSTSPTQWSQELRLLSDFQGPLNFLVGGFYLTYESEVHYRIRSTSIEAVGEILGIDPEFRIYDNDADKYELETFALFGEAYYQVTDDILVTLGARYTEEEKKSRQRTIYLAFLSDGTDENQGYANFDGKWDEPTGKFNITWDVSDDVMTYLTLSRSYKSGGFNPISADSPVIDPAQGGDPGLAEFDPEYINAIEVGVKSQLLDNSLQANLTYFYYDYEGLQISKIVNQTAINENFDAMIQGIEAEFIWLPIEPLRLSANIAWLDTEMDGGETIDPANINLLGTTQNIITTPFNNQLVGDMCPGGLSPCEGLPTSIDGNELPNAPAYSVNLGIAYTIPVGGMDLTAATNYYWQDEFYTRVFNTGNDTVDSWDVWNATVTLTNPEQGWLAEAWVRNITDDDYITGQYLGDQNVGLATNQFLLEPRTYGLTLSLMF
ncbi:MAG: TonB-dependent receptor [Halioglobus sp.]|nr:TonB-dependent receptor [Halioglobus sp.]